MSAAKVLNDAPDKATGRAGRRVPVREIERRLQEAQAHCSERGALLTPLRREVLELLLRRHGTAKAYDLQDDMRARHGRVAPTTVYRALDFLMSMQLVHRVDSVNSFVACQLDHEHEHPAHQALMLVCSQCGSVSETHAEHELASALRRLERGPAGFEVSAVEIKGRCATCTRRLPAAAAAAKPQA